MLLIILIYVVFAVLVSYIFSSKKGIPFFMLIQGLIFVPASLAILVFIFIILLGR